MTHGTDDELARGNVILIVDEHAVFARAVARVARGVGLAPRVAVTADVASVDVSKLAMLRAAIVSEEAFPIAELARQSRTTLPLLVTTTRASASLINRCFQLNATLIAKPLSGADHEALRRWIEHGASDSVAARVEALARARSLTSRQFQVVLLAATGHDRGAIATRLGISAHTLKGHVAELLGRCGADSLRSVVTLCAEPSRAEPSRAEPSEIFSAAHSLAQR